MDIENIKISFTKVKQDINNLHNELLNIKIEINELKNLINSLNLTIKPKINTSTDTSTNTTHNTTHTANTTHNTTVPYEIEGLKQPYIDSSTRNHGASTDRQTDTSTDTSTQKNTIKKENSIELNIQQASQILNSLDHLKREIRFKFKRVTGQEMAVFSTIYQLEEQDKNNVTYKQISLNLHLSESSVRDYVQRMINKGIPLKKQKINNKLIILSISQDLRKIASLSTILQLREL